MRLQTDLFSVIFKRHCFVSYLAGCHASMLSWCGECNAGAVVSAIGAPLPLSYHPMIEKCYKGLNYCILSITKRVPSTEIQITGLFFGLEKSFLLQKIDMSLDRCKCGINQTVQCTFINSCSILMFLFQMAAHPEYPPRLVAGKVK